MMSIRTQTLSQASPASNATRTSAAGSSGCTSSAVASIFQVPDSASGTSTRIGGVFDYSRATTLPRGSTTVKLSQYSG